MKPQQEITEEMEKYEHKLFNSLNSKIKFIFEK